MDKQEIVDIAMKLGTFEVSIEKYKDVCQTNSKKATLAGDPRELREIYRSAKLGTALRMSMVKAKRVSLEQER
jgi:adenylyl- and sulfurtransferase ThiI